MRAVVRVPALVDGLERCSSLYRFINFEDQV
jgi:hypothetical protein